MDIFEPINLPPQPFLQSTMDSTPWPDSVKTATVEQTKEILFALGWPMAVIPNILLCRMPPGWASDIHIDLYQQQSHQTVINIPVSGTHVMEWYDAVDPLDTLVYAPTGTDIALLRMSNARQTASTQACGLAYLANSSTWHRVVNYTEQWVWVMSIRYIPESYEPMSQSLSRLPWVANLRYK